ncbi:MAG: hypothetical protein E7322_06460 [Clostridiales bacterium]|nr:hypothetical protein [Clostridiales bacterium]
MLREKDISILRSLANEYASFAFDPKQEKTRRLWRKLNAFQMERPLLTIDQIPWNEMDVDGFLNCEITDPYWRNVESDLRCLIYKMRHMPADTALNPYVCLPKPIHNTGWGIEPVEKNHISLEAGSVAPSREYANQIETMDDLEKIKTPVLTLDVQKEKVIREEADVVFSGIIPYKMTGIVMHLGAWDWIAQWMGVTNAYIMLMDEPEIMHALMEKLTRGILSMIDQMNAQKLFDIHSNLCHCSHTHMDDFPKENAPETSENAWAFGLAQMFTCVSPKITDEFEVQYMSRIFPHFGRIYYGCCDRLDDRMDVIRKLPNVHKLSCSPFSDRARFAETMPDKCIMSAKPNPAFFATGTMDEDFVRRDIQKTISAAKEHNRNLEFLLKDISTVSHNPKCLWRWQEIVMEELMK